MSILPPFPTLSENSSEELEFELKEYFKSIALLSKFKNTSDLKLKLFNQLNNLIGAEVLNYDLQKDQILLSKNSQSSENKVQKGPFCGKLFAKNEPVYTCSTCAIDPTCVLCETCFNSTFHEGHDVHIHLHSSGYGCCDCGDLEAFKVTLDCEYHQPCFQKTHSELESNLSNTIKNKLPSLIRAVLDFSIDVFYCSNDDHFGQFDVDTIKKDGDELDKIWNPNAESTVRDYTLILWNDEFHGYDEVIDLSKRSMGHSDHMAKKVTAKIDEVGRHALTNSQNIEALIPSANIFTEADLNVTIRATIIYNLEELASLLLHYLSLLSNKDLEVWLDGSFSAYFLNILSDELLNFDHKPPIVQNESIVDTQHTFEPPKRPKTAEEFEYLQQSFGASRLTLIPSSHCLTFDEHTLYSNLDTQYPSCIKNINSYSQYFLPQVRFDRILQHDSVLWKALRLELQALFTRSLLSLPKFKSSAALHYAINFPYFANIDCNRNSEPDTNMLSYAVQVFTAPSIAELLTTDMHYIQFLLLLLEKHFFGCMTSPDEFDCSAIPDNFFQCPANFFEHNPNRSIIRALDYLLDHSSVRASISKDYVTQLQFLHFLSGFHGLKPATRKIEAHVEYEDVTYATKIETAKCLDDFIDMFSSAINLNPHYTALNVWYVLQKILGVTQEIFNSRVPAEFHMIGTASCSIQSIVKFKVENQSVSFYYILHWLLASLLKSTTIHQPDFFTTYGYQSLEDFFLKACGSYEPEIQNQQKLLQDIFDYPLRTLVLSAQVRSMLWIRNGHNLLIEEHFFRNKPDGYVMHNVFLTQVMLAVFPSDLALLTILDRYSLRSWLQTDSQHPIYSKSKLLFMINDFLLLILHCLIERDDIVGASHESRALAHIARSTFTAALFSDVNSQLPTFITKMPDFNQLLSKICDFKPPDTLSDSGHYQLKGAYSHLFNPYHYLLNHNQLDQAENFKKTHSTRESPYFLPNLAPLPQGTFYKMNTLLHEPLLAEILYFTLYHSINLPGAQEYLIDYVLQFFILASVEFDTESIQEHCLHYGSIWTHATKIKFSRGSDNKATCSELLIEIAKSYSNNDKEEKLLYVLDLLSKHGEQEAKEQIIEFISNRAATKENKDYEHRLEKRRKEAKARQEQIKRQFREAQSEFVERYNDLYQSTDQVEGELEVLQEDMASDPAQIHYLTGTCIICQEDVKSGGSYGIPCLIQPSRILSLFPFISTNLKDTIQQDNALAFFEKSHPTPVLVEFDTELTTSQIIPSVNTNCSGTYTSSCGHLIHLACLKAELSSDITNSSPFDFSNTSSNIYKMFRCPLCKSHNNVLLPISGNSGVSFSTTNISLSFTELMNDFNEARCRMVRTFNDKNPGHYLPEKIAMSSTKLLPTNMTFNHDSNSNNITDQMTFFSSDDGQKIFNESDIYLCTTDSQYSKELIEIYTVLIKACLKPYDSESIRNSGNSSIQYGTPQLLLDSLLLSLSYTITMLEVSDRSPKELNSSSQPFIFDRLSTLSRDTLVVLWNTILDINFGASSQYQKLSLRSVLGKLDLLCGQVKSSPLKEEPFILLVELAPFAVTSLGLDFRHLIQLLFFVQFTRLTVGCLFSSHYSEPPSSSNMFQNPSSLEKLMDHIIESSVCINSEGWSASNLTECYPFIRQNLIIFLRKVVIFMGALQFPLTRPDSSGDELEDLLEAIGFPPSEAIFDEAISSSVLFDLIKVWCQNLSWEAASKLLLEFPFAYHLPGLGPRMDSMLSVCSNKLKPTCKSVSSEATVCLLCREIICIGRECCNIDSSSLFRHKFTCSGYLGLFITPKSTRLTIMYKESIQYRESPYLNIHGQANPISASGRLSSLPLFLNNKRYNALLKSVLDHQIPNEISRSQN